MLLTVGAKAEVGESAAYDIKNAAASFILGDYFAAFRKPEINSDESPYRHFFGKKNYRSDQSDRQICGYYSR